jgi:hypothetical protein
LIHFILIFKGNEYDIILGSTIHSYENKHTSLTNNFLKMGKKNIYIYIETKNNAMDIRKIYLQIIERLFNISYLF